MQRISKIELLSKEKKSTETDSEMTEIIKLAYKDIKTAIINILHLMRKLQERLNMLSINMEDTEKDPRLSLES